MHDWELTRSIINSGRSIRVAVADSRRIYEFLSIAATKVVFDWVEYTSPLYVRLTVIPTGKYIYKVRVCSCMSYESKNGMLSVHGSVIFKNLSTGGGGGGGVFVCYQLIILKQFVEANNFLPVFFFARFYPDTHAHTKTVN